MGWQGGRADRRGAGEAAVQLIALSDYFHALRRLLPVRFYV